MTERAALGQGASNVDVGRKRSHSRQRAGRGPSGGQSTSKSIGLASKLSQNGKGACASGGSRSWTLWRSSVPCSTGADFSSCSSPSPTVSLLSIASCTPLPSCLISPPSSFSPPPSFSLSLPFSFLSFLPSPLFF